MGLRSDDEHAYYDMNDVEEIRRLTKELAAAKAEASQLRAVIAGALYHVQHAQAEGAMSGYDIGVERRVDDAESILMGCRAGINGEHPYDSHCVDPLAVSK